MSYLNGLILCVFSIACLLVDSLVLCCLFFLAPLSPYWPDGAGWFTTTLFFFTSPGKNITPLSVESRDGIYSNRVRENPCVRR